MNTVITTMLSILAGATVLLVILGGVRRGARLQREAEQLELERLFRPALLELLSQDAPDLDDLQRFADMEGAAGETIDALAGKMMPKLRGRDRDTLRRLLEHRGAFDRARRETRSSIAVRRLRAVDLLGDGEVLGAIPEMARLLDDPNPAVRKATARAIGKIGSPEAAVVLMRELVARRAPLSVIGMAIIHIGPAGSGALCHSLGSDDVIERALAAECLGIINASDAGDELRRLLDRERDELVRSAACRSLGRIGDPRSTALLISLLADDPHASVRAAAAQALGRIGDDAAIEHLVEAAHDPAPEVARATTAALRWMGSTAIARLEGLGRIAGLTGAFAREALDLANIDRNRREVLA